MPFTKGHTHAAKRDRTGQRVGWLTVIREVPNPVKGADSLWLCRCDCGNERNVSSRHVERTKSCGCQSIRRLRAVEPPEVKRQVTMNGQYCNHIHGAMRASSMPLTRDVWDKLVIQPCAYCGDLDTRNIAETSSYRQSCRLMTETRRAAYAVKMNGIDRVDNTLGYVPSNCVSCCKTCNLMKNNIPRDEFINHLHLIRDHVFKT